MVVKCHPFNEGQNNRDKGIFPTQAEEALLDEFFSLLASIALRLTIKAAGVNNGLNASKGEAGRL